MNASNDEADNRETPEPSPEELLEPFRNYLEILADMELDRNLRSKLDPVDVVQNVMLKAYRGFGDLRDTRPQVLTAWLRQIMSNTLADEYKKYRRGSRNVELERSINVALDRSSESVHGWLAADQTSPSSAAGKNEQLLSMFDALNRLPSHIRQALILRHLENLKLAEVAERMQRTTASVTKLIFRGQKLLRQELDAGH